MHMIIHEKHDYLRVRQM